MSLTYLTLPEAASRSGRSIGHLRRLCQDKYAPAGAAERRAVGPKPEWHIREDADPAFARVKSADQIGRDLSHLTDRKRQEAFYRLDLLKRWEQAERGRCELGLTKHQITRQFIAVVEAKEGRALNMTSLYEWQRKYRAGGVAALADSRGGKHESTAAPADDRFFDLVKLLWLNVRKPSLKSCYLKAEYEADRSGWAVESYRTIHRRITKIPGPVVDKFRNGEEEFVRNSMPYNERDYGPLHTNEMWDGDHHQCDVICTHGGEFVRPWITAWQDMRSRKIVGWRIFAHSPNSDTIILAMRDAVQNFGVPREVLIDNGRDYDCYALNGRTKADRWKKSTVVVNYDDKLLGGLFGALGVDVTHCLPYHGQSKPIERWFGTLESQFGKDWPTYCGPATHQKPENLQLQLERGKAPTLETFIAAFEAYLATFHGAIHTGQAMEGRSPDQVFAAEWRDHSKVTASEEMLWWFTLKQTKPVKCGQNGVTYNGIRYGATNAFLMQHKGTEVILRVDPGRVNEVIVCELSGKPICVAQSNQRLAVNATNEEVKAAQRELGGDRKRVKAYHQSRPRMAMDLVDRTLVARAAENAKRAAENPQPAPEPPTIKPVRSPFESDISKLRNDFEQENLKIAVGAEHMSFDELGQKFRPGAPTEGRSGLLKLADSFRPTEE